MGAKHQSYSFHRGIPREMRQRIHPIWRGIGFLFMVLIPILGYAAAQVLLDLNGKNNWFPLPIDLLARPGMFLYSAFPDPLLYIKLILSFVFIMLLYMIFTLVTFIVMGTFGVSNNKRDPYYVPPVTRRRRKQF
jgi:hypothetical protein